MLFGYADQFSSIVNLFFTDSSKINFHPQYFSSIVGYDQFEKDHILVAEFRTLTKYITDETKVQFCGWSAESIEKIKKLLTIISMERGRTNEQQVVFAFIKDVRKQGNEIKVYFQKFYLILFSFLKDNLSDFAMRLLN